jgi:Escherichia/Staphylococcus phage prohead protease
MKFKDIKLQIKDVTDSGQFEGYAAAFNNEDLGGDVITPGAFSKTMSENTKVPILWGHNTREVIGVNQQMSEDAKGLKVTGQLALDVQRARETHSLMKMGAVKGLSIGYDPIVVDYSRMEKDNVRILREVKLWEYSVTPFPMNPEATVTAVKSMQDLENMLHELIAYKGESIPSEEQAELIERVIKKLSALQAAKFAPEAAKHDEIAPEILHASSEQIDSISKLLRGEL